MNTLLGTTILTAAIFGALWIGTNKSPETLSCNMDCEGKQDCETRQYPSHDSTTIDRECVVWTEDGGTMDWCCARVAL